jgi:hypothetical protein
MAEEGPNNRALEPFEVSVDQSPSVSNVSPQPDEPKLPDIHDGGPSATTTNSFSAAATTTTGSASDDDGEAEYSDDGLGGHERKLRDLSHAEVHEFPGVKREKWWCVVLL